MKRVRLFWQIFPACVGISIGLLLVLYLTGRRSLEEFYWQEVTDSLKTQVRFVSQAAAVLLKRDDRAGLDALVKQMGRDSGVRLTVVLPSGRVLAESNQNPLHMDDHHDRPEIATALRSGEFGQSVRRSPTLDEAFLYVAYAWNEDGKTKAVVRAARSTAAIQQGLDGLLRRILAAALAAVVLSVAASWALARRISLPLEVMTDGVQRFGGGDLEHRLPITGSRELATLAESLNDMASQLEEQIQTVVRQGNEQEAVLQSMEDGVLTLDTQGRILDLNAAGQRMFGLDASQVHGRYIQEVLRRPRLLNFVEALLASFVPRQEEIVIYDEGRRVLAAYGNTLRNAKHEPTGILIVLREVTRLQQLETMRRDFVANVSHELRTPLTAIKGYLETLLDGGLADKELTERFFKIIVTQTDRLTAILDDVLSLARIEKETEERQVQLEPTALHGVVQSAVAACTPQAEGRGIRLHCDCPEDLSARIHPGLLEQALVNLIDNAIKYSEPNKEIWIEAAGTAEGVRLSVLDQGCGIEARHLHRLFERFYRVDASRSRKTGGTGLGLAIVQHNAIAHGGWTSVESTPGHGSRFSIHLPNAA